MAAFLEFHAISKQFPGVQALDRVSFSVREGSVHGLVGENGAGKSTLLRILSGAHAPTGGTMLLGGKEVRFSSPREALDAGVAVIYQELNLVPDMSVAENLLLGHIPNRKGFIKKDSLVQAARGMLDYLMEDINPNIKVKRLPIAQRQMIEIGKALLHDAKMIAFDEPTSSLSATETRQLFRIIGSLKAKGCAIIYVSHRLNEFFEVCDALTVFRDGTLVESFEDMGGVTHDLVVSRMVGRAIEDIYGYRPRHVGERVLDVRELTGPRIPEPASFFVRSGEIVGFFGLVGSGRSELMRILYGVEKAATGTITLRGKPVSIDSPARALSEGIVLCPEDRKLEGIIRVRDVKENINISVRRHFVKAGLFLDNARERANAADFIEKLHIKTPSMEQLAGNLSGGNQQKIVLARNLSVETAVIILDEPTRGIDVGTKSEIYRLIYDLAEAGKAVVVVSSELPEIIGISDRIVIMSKGRIVAEVPREQATEESVLQHALVGHNGGQTAQSRGGETS
jgi:L-arabinose transport system ATP-binding protein